MFPRYCFINYIYSLHRYAADLSLSVAHESEPKTNKWVGRPTLQMMTTGTTMSWTVVFCCGCCCCCVVAIRRRLVMITRPTVHENINIKNDVELCSTIVEWRYLQMHDRSLSERACGSLTWARQSAACVWIEDKTAFWRVQATKHYKISDDLRLENRHRKRNFSVNHEKCSNLSQCMTCLWA